MQAQSRSSEVASGKELDQYIVTACDVLVTRRTSLSAVKHPSACSVNTDSMQEWFANVCLIQHCISNSCIVVYMYCVLIGLLV